MTLGAKAMLAIRIDLDGEVVEADVVRTSLDASQWRNGEAIALDSRFQRVDDVIGKTL